VLDELVEKFPSHLQLVFKNFPLSSHEHAEEAARAAMAAEKQGKFWEMHHTLFENQESGLDRKNLDRLARQIGLDMKQFSTDIESEAIADRVDADRKQADKLGLRGTPMIYINGRHFELELFNLVEDLDPWISLEIEARTGKKVAPKAIPKKDAAVPAPAPSASAAAK
jgi:protein-disulfide isomerase